MKLGYFNQLQMPKPWPENAEVALYKEAMEQAVRAEAVGFDYYWQTEHHFYPEIGHSSCPELFLAALAQHTSTIRLGLGVVVLPCNHPFRVVEFVSTLDVLSGGRVDFGTGRGASIYHTEAFGYDSDESKEQWEESIQVICSMFMNDPFPGWKGKHYDLPRRDLVPKPVQKPHPPLWLAATQPATFAKAARMGMGILGFSATEPDKMIPAIQAYKEAMPECKPIGGYANHQIAAFAICNIDKDYTVGRDKACAAARWYFGENDVPLQKLRFGSHEGKFYEEAAGGKRQGVLESILDRSNDQLIEDGIVIGGDVDSVCRGLEKWMDLGIDQILLMIQAGNTTHDDTMKALDLLGSRVIPRFKESAPTPTIPAS
jgi:alkanesulfonate monooxygenase SsuD/methylene tetrahydromethanopterin reductase-like flavin-dependent oxidoreductase (luciferase family)